LVEQEVLLNLRTVGSTMVGVYIASVLLCTVLWLLPTGPTSRFDFALADAFLVLLLGLEIGYLVSLSWVIRWQKPFPRVFNLGIAALESFQPTFFLWLWGQVLPPEAALSQSPLFFYFLFLSLNTLRLDAAVSVFSGLVAMVGYLGLAAFLFVRAGVSDPWKVVTSVYASKGVFLFLCGVISAFVASQMRRRLVHSVKAAQSLGDSLRKKKAAPLEEEERNLALVTQEAQAEIRDFWEETWPVRRWNQGFLGALKEWLGRFEAESGMVVELKGATDRWDDLLTSVRKTQTLRILQEALNNVRRHAEVRRASLTFSEFPEGLRIEVSDQGRGFSPALTSGSLPFGLEMMKHRAEQAGGTLVVDSAPGAGCRVVLEFSVPSVRSARILVVDEHRLFLEGLSQLLLDGGYQLVGSATDADQALSLVRALHPDVVLIDLQLGGMDGLMATRIIKTEFPETRVIILTAVATQSFVLEASKAGASGYAFKNFPAKELFQTIDSVMVGNVMTNEEVDRILKTLPPPGGDESLHRLDQLSFRQLEVLQWAAAGLTYKEIGQKLFISERTVKFHMAEIVEKLQVKDRLAATRLLRKP